MSGVTNTTVKNLILDAGVVYINYEDETNERILGATTGGNKFSVEREFRDIEVDGVKGKTKGLRRIITENSSLEVNLKEMSAKNIQVALAGSTLGTYPATTPTHDTIISNGKIVDADYISNVALVATVSGSTEPCVIILYNALSDGNLEMNLQDKNEAVITLTLSAHYDPADLSDPLYEIRYPKIS
jgi:hypothetical protein